jgi:hypothetical protein
VVPRFFGISMYISFSALIIFCPCYCLLFESVPIPHLAHAPRFSGKTLSRDARDDGLIHSGQAQQKVAALCGMLSAPNKETIP